MSDEKLVHDVLEDMRGYLDRANEKLSTVTAEHHRDYHGGRVEAAERMLAYAEPEIVRLRAKVTELQGRGTELVTERRGAVAPAFMRVFAFAKRLEETSAWTEEPYRSKPTIPEQKIFRFYLTKFIEEAIEFLIAATPTYQVAPSVPHKVNRSTIATLHDVRRLLTQLIADADFMPSLPEFMHELSDVKYVLEHLAIVCGVRTEPVDAIVHRVNMGRSVKDGIAGKSDVSPVQAIAAELAKQHREACDESS